MQSPVAVVYQRAALPTVRALSVSFRSLKTSAMLQAGCIASFAVHRLACVSCPSFPLQLVLRQHPEWVDGPAAVVAEDKPQAAILWVNEHAYQRRVLPGLRYSEGLALTADLRAATIEQHQIAAEVDQLARILRRFSPFVEPMGDEPGLFWIDASGLKRLYNSISRWARAIAKTLTRRKLQASIVVGFSRFGTYALARSSQGVQVLADAKAEHLRIQSVPLSRLGVDAELRDALHRLAIDDVGSFLRLPATGLLERFGQRAYRLHQLASDAVWAPLVDRPDVVPVFERIEFEQAEADATRLLFQLKRCLDRLLSRLAERRQALVSLRMRFHAATAVQSVVRPAAPTLDGRQLVDLIRLRLERLSLKQAVNMVELDAQSVDATAEQLQLFTQAKKRDLVAGNRALARLRAEFGDQAVVRAELCDRHLPEAQFVWLPLTHLQAKPIPKSVNRRPRPLVRRFFAKGKVLCQQRPTEDGWLIAGLAAGPMERQSGPYIVSGGWWQREVHREYYFSEMRRGDTWWIYYDRVRGRWFVQAVVE